MSYLYKKDRNIRLPIKHLTVLYQTGVTYPRQKCSTSYNRIILTKYRTPFFLNSKTNVEYATKYKSTNLTVKHDVKQSLFINPFN